MILLRLEETTRVCA